MPYVPWTFKGNTDQTPWYSRFFKGWLLHPEDQPGNHRSIKQVKNSDFRKNRVIVSYFHVIFHGFSVMGILPLPCSIASFSMSA